MNITKSKSMKKGIRFVTLPQNKTAQDVQKTVVF